MKKFALSLLICFVCAASLIFSYYMTRETEFDDISVELVYEMAVKSGYDGTITQFIDEFRGAIGADGRGIKNAEVNSDGHLIITYTDGATVDAGIVNVGALNISEGISGASVNRALTSSVSLFAERADGNYNVGAGVIYRLDRDLGTAVIITNNHVLYDDGVSAMIENGKISAYLYGMELPAFRMSCELVGASSSLDIAVLKISECDLLKSQGVTEACIYDSEMVSVLDEVVAVGNPGGNGLSVISGAVSVESENRYVSIGASGGTIFMRVIRFDASVNKGNSGGGLYDSEGRLIGIVTARDSQSQGVSFAIPINLASAVADNILHYCENSTEQKGRLIKLGIGLDVGGATVYYDPASDRTVKVYEVIVKSVEEGSYASSMGLQVGDRLISVTLDGVKTVITGVHQAPEMNYRAFIGSEITYTVLRGGETLSFTVTVPSDISVLN